MENLKQKTLSGFVYKFGERGFSLAVSFVVQIILARLLLPEEFGTIALLTVLMTILDVFVTYGFGNSLVVNKESDDLDFSTCFFFGIVFSLLVYVVIFVSSPFISSFFYGRSDLDLLIKIMALRMPVSAINSVQHAYVSKLMRFKLFFYSTLIGTVLSGIIGVVMAYMGFGIWALVAQYLGNAIFGTGSLWIFSKWSPKWVFSFQRLKRIYDYGWKILFVGLIDTVYSQISSLVIAKKYSTSDLAYYNRGASFPGIGTSLIEPTIDAVLFPALSNCNDDQILMKNVTKRVSNTSTYLICAIMFLLAAIAEPMIDVLLTSKWASCVIFLQITCMSGIFRPMQVINNCVIRASGKSGLLLKINIIKKGIGLLLLIMCMHYGVVAIAISMVATNFISTLINIFPNRNILRYGYMEQFRDLFHNMLVPLIMGIVVWIISFAPIPYFYMLIIQLTVGVGLFIGMSKVLNVESYQYLQKLIINQKMK